MIIDHFMLATIFESLSKQHFEADRRQKAQQESLRINNPTPVPSPFFNPMPQIDGLPLTTTTDASNPYHSVDWDLLRARLQQGAKL